MSAQTYSQAVSTQPNSDTIQLSSSDSLIVFSPDSTITRPDSIRVEPEGVVQFADSLGAGLLSLPIAQDSLQLDSLVADSVTVDSAAFSLFADQPRSDINTTINYKAVDSVFFDVRKQNVLLYGTAEIDYGDINLDADQISIDWVDRTLEADYTLDSTGRKIGKPIFTEKGQSYETDEMTYNFQTRKAIIQGIITQQGEAYMQGEKVKKNADNELFIRNAKYTTCNLADPHFHISSRRLKAIPGNKVLSGPFNLAFREVETPLGFLFGMFPQPRKKTSGVIVPKYGEERRRGFFLRDGGYYFAVSDYTDLRLTGSIYSTGGYSLNLANNYKVRYRNSGNVRFSFNRFITNEPTEQIDTRDFSLTWSHRPETRGTSRFSSSVNIRTNSFNQNNNLVAEDFNQSINAQFSSNVSYSKSFTGFNISTNLRHNQNVQTKVVTITAPEFTYNMNRIYPFKNIPALNKGVLGKLNFSHNFTAKADISNGILRGISGVDVLNENPLNDSILAFNGENIGAILQRTQIGGRHRIPLSTSFNLFNYITVSPSISYSELWYTRELNYTYVPEEEGVRIDTLNGFSRAGSYSVSAGFNTRLYGTYFFKKGKIEAIRHVLTPQVSMSYSPDFTKSKFGFFDEVQINEEGDTRRFSRYEGFSFGSPPIGESAALSMTLNNNLEMKVKDKKDSTGKASRKIKIFENLSFSSSYNFLADSFKLSDIRFSTRTRLFNDILNLTINGTIDPYLYVLDSVVETSRSREVFQRQVHEFAWNRGEGLGRLSIFSVAGGFRLTPRSFEGRGGEEDKDEKKSDFGTEEELDYINANPEEYIDFSIPWSFAVNYTVNRRQTGFEDPTVTQSLNFNGDLSITDNTKIDFRSGYDFRIKEFTQTSINVVRDLHCWTMRFNWVPFGRFQSFSITINAKSALLQDLKLEKRRRFFDNL